MLVVHHLENSRSHRILWLLEELSLPYELRHYKRDPKTMLAPASLRAIHPLGKSPILEDNGLVLVESGAIIEYVLDTTAKAVCVRPHPPPKITTGCGCTTPKVPSCRCTCGSWCSARWSQQVLRFCVLCCRKFARD